jgi:glucose/arabinose dehydrogenase
MKITSPLKTFAAALLFGSAACSAMAAGPLTGREAFGDWRADAPGRARLIRPQDLPAPGATPSASNSARLVARPASAVPQVPSGFTASLYAEGLSGPRLMRTAPNGDVFVAETRAGRIRVLRPTASGAPGTSIYASGLERPFGIAFYPSGPQPRFVYVATPGAVLRFPYSAGDTTAAAPPQKVADLPAGGGHSTRDIVFTDGDRRMLVSVGSAGNAGEGMGEPPRQMVSSPPGAAWGHEADRAAVLSFDPEGGGRRLFATGLRNCVGLAVAPSGDVWCSVNERDGLGEDLVPDYATRIRDGAFYGWPWFYLGASEDPRHRGARPDLAGRVTVPDVLLQAHSAPLAMTFYEGSAFPDAYRGDAFVALHGSWNRARRTGYKVVRLRMADGKPTGVYEDFVTGFVASDSEVWGRPVGVTVAGDGALLVSDDAGGTIWRVAPAR